MLFPTEISSISPPAEQIPTEISIQILVKLTIS